ncbi:MAG: SCP2 sterol-binding domain-containing protein [Gammaproteobacteria bacterium]|nr:SCP2 sterol-binding domain-containing protein [Gammaproteobacteria bacterium]MYE51504.1 SCP2 sterol-binding domain-containing protein [Gammaproteobacteria bacterium]MYF52027.1 SCP2 sterol-binding domain-containing protein [Gammaproteobacteria bacterium]
MNPIDALFADLAETLGNALLNLDADAKQRLADLEGRCIRIECTLPNKSATLKVQRSRVAVSAEAIGEADAVVQGSMADLIAWVLGGASAESTAVRIEGDQGALAEVTAAITPNLVNQLSSALSNSPGEDVLGALELAAAGLRSAAEGTAHAIEQGLKSSPDGLSPLAQLTPAFELLREGVLDLALKAQELAKPSRGDLS